MKLIKMANISSSSIRWAFNVRDWKPSKEQWKLCLQCVQKEEVERCNRFAFVDDCKSSMVGQLLMRKAVNESVGIAYEKITFSRTSAGKPFLMQDNETEFYFNVSHHGNYCVLASEHDFNVGVDVMKIEHRGKRPVADFFNAMQKQFSASEWSYISLPGLEREQLERFFRLWCLKESYVKATGTGIACDLQNISFSCPSPALKLGVVTSDTLLSVCDQLLVEWRFEEMLLDTGHCVAVALGPSSQEATKSLLCSKPKHFVLLTFEELMKNCVPFVSVDSNFWETFSSKEEKHV